MKPGIEIYIDELILDGFAREGRYDIAAAIEHHLVQLLSEHGIPKSFLKEINIAQLNAGTINLQAGTKPKAVGTSIADSVYKELNGKKPFL